MALPPPDAVSTAMDTEPPHAATLAQRVQRFLVKRRVDGAPLTAEEDTNVAAALAGLESGRYPEGEDAMMLAEKGWQPRGEVGVEIPAEVLAQRLAELLQV
jgi:hypothetical protein